MQSGSENASLTGMDIDHHQPSPSPAHPGGRGSTQSVSGSVVAPPESAVPSAADKLEQQLILRLPHTLAAEIRNLVQTQTLAPDHISINPKGN